MLLFFVPLVVAAGGFTHELGGSTTKTFAGRTGYLTPAKA